MRTLQLPYIILAFSLFTNVIHASPTTQPASKLPHIQVEIKNKTVRVDCEAVKADYPLEFLVVVTGTNEYESLARSPVKPSDLHLAMIMIGLTPGQPIHFDKLTNTWMPPTGPPIDIWFEYKRDGKLIKIPAYQWMRDVKTKKQPPPMSWVFTGSKIMDDQTYAADVTGCLVGVINNELSVIDIPALKSRAIEARNYERNPDFMPPTGTPFTMILSPATSAPSSTTRPANKK